jgi:DNA-binding transcriptional MerR regulator
VQPSKQHLVLNPPDRGTLWQRLALPKTQVAALCGLTPRQVSYWTRRGYLPVSDRHPVKYTGEAIDYCILIKQGLSRGLSLRRAVESARATLEAERTQGSPALPDPPSLDQLYTQLCAAETALKMALGAVMHAPAAPPAAPPDGERGMASHE